MTTVVARPTKPNDIEPEFWGIALVMVCVWFALLVASLATLRTDHLASTDCLPQPSFGDVYVSVLPSPFSFVFGAMSSFPSPVSGGKLLAVIGSPNFHVVLEFFSVLFPPNSISGQNFFSSFFVVGSGTIRAALLATLLPTARSQIKVLHAQRLSTIDANLLHAMEGKYLLHISKGKTDGY